MISSQILSTFMPIFMLAIALSMDAFSVSLGMGTIALRKQQIFHIRLVVDVFHIVMPLVGIALGQYLAERIGTISSVIGGLLLMFIGLQIFFSSFTEQKVKKFVPIGIGLYMFAFGVSVDSLTIGLGLGMFGTKVIVTLVLFGAFSCMFTWLGLWLGRTTHMKLGSWTSILGGGILIAFSLLLLFHTYFK